MVDRAHEDEPGWQKEYQQGEYIARAKAWVKLGVTELQDDRWKSTSPRPRTELSSVWQSSLAMKGSTVSAWTCSKPRTKNILGTRLGLISIAWEWTSLALWQGTSTRQHHRWVLPWMVVEAMLNIISQIQATVMKMFVGISAHTNATWGWKLCFFFRHATTIIEPFVVLKVLKLVLRAQCLIPNCPIWFRFEKISSYHLKIC